MVKMIVFDLDGTLLDIDREISNRTIEYLSKLKNNGYIIVLASGRILSSQKDVTRGLSFVNYAITGAGSECYEISSDKTLFDYPIDKDIAKRIIPYFDDNCIYIDVCDKNVIYSFTDMNKPEEYIKCTKNWDYIFDNIEHIYHLAISLYSNENIVQIKEQLEKDIPELDVYFMQDSFSNQQWIEIFQKGCSKYKAIKKLADYLNIKNEEIMAFGDGLNDIDMIEKCGIGVAMNNALDEVKNKADYVTKLDCNNDGVIEFLKEYLNV